MRFFSSAVSPDHDNATMTSSGAHIHSEDTVREIDLEIRRIIDAAYETVYEILVVRHLGHKVIHVRRNHANIGRRRVQLFNKPRPHRNSHNLLLLCAGHHGQRAKQDEQSPHFELPRASSRIRFAREGLNTPHEQNRCK